MRATTPNQMRSGAIIILVLACLLNQVAYQALPVKGDGHATHIAAAPQCASDVLLRTSDSARLPRIVEALLAVYVVPQITAPAVDGARDGSNRRGRELRPTLQRLDVRLQV